MTNQVERDERIRLYGRESQVEQVDRSRAAVTLILGDSGIGKSAVLTSAQMHSRRGAIAPAPRTITRSGAALQNALLQSLADAVAEVIAVDGNAKHVASLVADAAKRLARDRGQELAKVIGKELLSLIRGRIGEGAGDVIGAYVLELKTSVDEQLTSRITAAMDPGVVGLLIQFAAEVCALAGERRVFLALDSGERLREEDVRLLADIAEALPSHLHLRVALSTHDVSQREKADYLILESRAIAAHDVDPLGHDAISEWLAERGLDPVIAPDVERLSGGYALHVGDLIEHLHRGGEIEEAPLNEQFAKRTREAWRALDPQSAAHARAISVFTDPLPADRLEVLLSLSPHQRGEFEERLVEARVFSVQVNGQRWFHEQRRLFIVEEILDEAERTSASATAVRVLWQMYLEGVGPPRFSELAKLVAAAPQLTETDAGLAAMTELSHDEVAVAAALIELIDRAARHPAVGGNELLTYAMTVFGAVGDLVAAAQSLQARGLLVIVEDQGRTAVVPYGWNSLMGATLSGRAEVEFGRRPIPAAGSAVFTLEIQPRLGVFRKAMYGHGRPSFESLAGEAARLSEPSGGLVVIGSANDPALLLRMSHGGRPMNVVATFGSEEARESANARLATLRTETLNEELKVTHALRYPSPLVPSHRFVSALSRIVPGNLGQSPSLKLSEALTPTIEIERRARTLQVIRSLCSDVEAQAMQIETPTGLAWYSPDGPIFEVEIRGGREGSEELDALPGFDWENPFALFHLARHLKLSPDEWIAQQRFRSAKQPIRDDPVVETIALLTKRAMAFNNAQSGYRTIRLERECLKAEISAALQRQLKDAEALASLPIGTELRMPAPRNVYLAVVQETQPAPSRFSSMIVWGSLESQDGNQQVEVAFAETGDVGRGPSVLEKIFGIDIGETDGAALGVPEAVLAALLGYGVEEIRLD